MSAHTRSHRNSLLQNKVEKLKAEPEETGPWGRTSEVLCLLIC